MVKTVVKLPSIIMTLAASLLQKISYSTPTLNVGECWYVKLPQATAVSKIQLQEVTDDTVLVTFPEHMYKTSESRFQKSDIIFVERIN